MDIKELVKEKEKREKGDIKKIKKEIKINEKKVNVNLKIALSWFKRSIKK